MSVVPQGVDVIYLSSEDEGSDDLNKPQDVTTGSPILSGFKRNINAMEPQESIVISDSDDENDRDRDIKRVKKFIRSSNNDNDTNLVTSNSDSFQNGSPMYDAPYEGEQTSESKALKSGKVFNSNRLEGLHSRKRVNYDLKNNITKHEPDKLNGSNVNGNEIDDNDNDNINTNSITHIYDDDDDDDINNTNPNNRGSDVDIDDDDDDDIVELPPDEVSKQRFKQTSFENAKNGHGSFSNIPYEIVHYPPQYNDPAPVPHFGGADSLQVEEEISQERKKRLTRCQQEKSQLETKVLDLHKEYSTAEQRTLRAMQVLNDLTRERSHLNQQDGARLNTIDTSMRQKSKEIYELNTFKLKCKNVIQSITNRLAILASNISRLSSTISSGIVDVYDNIVVDDIDEKNGRILKKNLEGFSANVYSNSEQKDLETLLSNIRPDEEIDEEGIEATPSEMAVTLLKHQRLGLTWLLRMEDSQSKGGILADDMGLGKTVQAIALIAARRSPKGFPTLVMAPVSLLHQWAAEIESKVKRSSAISVAIYHSIDKKRLSTWKDMSKYDVIFTSYGTLSSEYKKHFYEAIKELEGSEDDDTTRKFKTSIPDYNMGGKSYTSPFYSSDTKFHRIILDESQAIKNKNTVCSKAVFLLRATYRFCLSGTPIQNGIIELYPSLRFLRIRPYNNEDRFRMELALPLKSKTDNYDEYDKKKSMQKIRALLKAIMLRRTKDSMIDGKKILELPEKHIEEKNVCMDVDEKSYYESLETGIKAKARSMMESDSISYSNILVLLLRLRQACCHQYLVKLGEMNNAEKNRNGNKFKENDCIRMYELAYKLSPSIVNSIMEEVDVLKKDIQAPKEKGNAMKFEFLEDNLEDELIKLDRDTYQDLDTKDNAGTIKSEITVPEESNDFHEIPQNLFTCPICYDILDYSVTKIFPSCGHMVCINCVENFFERFEIGDSSSDKGRVAECMTCKVRVKEHSLIDFNIFHKIHIEKKTLSQIISELKKEAQINRTSNSDKISTLIKENKGKFVPSAKIEEAIRIVKKILNNNVGEKIIIFSQFISLFDLMKLVFNHAGIKFLRYDGSLSIEEKNNIVKKFYQDGQYSVLLISLRAGNVGLTLTCANHVIIMDPFWNPFVEEQAMDRAHRIGQQREVHVYRVLIQGTVESRIMDLQESKKKLIGTAFDDAEMKNVSKLGKQELGFLFGLNSL